MTKINDKIKELVEPLVSNNGFELHDLEYKKEGGGWILRVFVDNKTKNISLDECAKLSGLIGELLDTLTDDELSSYSLEVSSPGLDRLLRNDSDFLWASGKTLKVKFLNDENKKEVLEGKLQNFSGDYIELASATKKETIYKIKKSSIESARRVMKFDELLPKDHKN